jgi:hypothetical protein
MQGDKIRDGGEITNRNRPGVRPDVFPAVVYSVPVLPKRISHLLSATTRSAATGILAMATTTNDLISAEAGGAETQPLLSTPNEQDPRLAGYGTDHLDDESRPPLVADEADTALKSSKEGEGLSRSRILWYLLVGLLLAGVVGVAIKAFIDRGDFHVSLDFSGYCL